VTFIRVRVEEPVSERKVPYIQHQLEEPLEAREQRGRLSIRSTWFLFDENSILSKNVVWRPTVSLARGGWDGTNGGRRTNQLQRRGSFARISPRTLERYVAEAQIPYIRLPPARGEGTDSFLPIAPEEVARPAHRQTIRRYRGSEETHMPGKYVKTKYRGVFCVTGSPTSDMRCRGRRQAPSFGRAPAKETPNWLLRGCGNAKQRLPKDGIFQIVVFEKASFAELAEYWWENRGKTKRTASSNNRYPRILEHFKAFAARDITPEAIESFLKSLHQVEWVPIEGSAKYDPKAKRTRIAKKPSRDRYPLSASSKNQYRTILSGIFSFNIKRGRYDVNPVKAVRQEKEPAGRDSLMMPDEFRQFRAKCQEVG